MRYWVTVSDLDMYVRDYSMYKNDILRLEDEYIAADTEFIGLRSPQFDKVLIENAPVKKGLSQRQNELFFVMDHLYLGIEALKLRVSIVDELVEFLNGLEHIDATTYQKIIDYKSKGKSLEWMGYKLDYSKATIHRYYRKALYLFINHKIHTAQ